MKRVRILAVILMVVMMGFALSACIDDEVTQIYEYKEMKITEDAAPLSYVRVLVVIANADKAIEYKASDFAIIRNGVRENGKTFITGFQFEEVNGDRTYVSDTDSTVSIANNTGKSLDIVFTGIDNITELYYKLEKIALTK